MFEIRKLFAEDWHIADLERGYIKKTLKKSIKKNNFLKMYKLAHTKQFGDYFKTGAIFYDTKEEDNKKFLEYLFSVQNQNFILKITNNFSNINNFVDTTTKKDDIEYIVETVLRFFSNFDLEPGKREEVIFNISRFLTIKTYLKFLKRADSASFDEDDFNFLYQAIEHCVFVLDEFEDSETDIKILEDYFKIRFKKDGKSEKETEMSLSESSVVYNMTHKNTAIVSHFINKNTINAFLANKTHFDYSSFLLTIVDGDNYFDFLHMFFSDDFAFESILNIVPRLHSSQTKVYNLIMDSFACKKSDIIVEMLEKSELNQKQKEEILLLKARKSCRI